MAKAPVLITGGGRGIGAATALMAAARGHAVSIVFRDRTAEAESLVERIVASGGKALAIRADIAVESDVKRAVEQTCEALGGIGALVNSAGTTGGMTPVSDVSAAQLTDVFAVNVIGSFLCVREAVSRMTGGAIVNVSSRAACLGAPGVWVHYAASKGAIDTMTIGLAKELASRGIRVNGVRPGFIESEIHHQRPTGAVDALVKTIPLQRMGRPEEVAAAIMWLLSDEASYVTGAVIDVAGGA